MDIYAQLQRLASRLDEHIRNTRMPNYQAREVAEVAKDLRTIAATLEAKDDAAAEANPKRFYGNLLTGIWLLANGQTVYPAQLGGHPDLFPHGHPRPVTVDWKECKLEGRTVLWPHVDGEPLVYDEAT